MTNNPSPAGEKILEGNRLIAKFMGGKFLHDFNPTYVTFRPINFGGMTGDYSCQLSDCRFDSSWDWLMPVCKRIVEMYFDKREEIFLGLNKCNIEDTWKAVVKFISFWNDDTQEKMIWRGKPVSEQQLKWRNSKINEWYNQQTPTNG